MRHIARKLVDRDQITRPIADESPHGSESTIGLLVVTVAALAFVVCVATFSFGEVGAGIDAASVGLLAFGAGLSWLSMDRRRIRQAEREFPTRDRAH
jgi:hypothetical protein